MTDEEEGVEMDKWKDAIDELPTGEKAVLCWGTYFEDRSSSTCREYMLHLCYWDPREGWECIHTQKRVYVEIWRQVYCPLDEVTCLESIDEKAENTCNSGPFLKFRRMGTIG